MIEVVANAIPIPEVARRSLARTVEAMLRAEPGSAPELMCKQRALGMLEAAALITGVIDQEATNFSFDLFSWTVSPGAPPADEAAAAKPNRAQRRQAARHNGEVVPA